MKIVCITPQLKTDYLATSIIEGLKLNGHNLYCTSLGNGVDKTYTEQEIFKHALDADYIFVIWGKNTPFKYYNYFLDGINQPHKCVYIDGSEYSYTGRPDCKIWLNYEMIKKCKWYFKRECREEDENIGIIPLPFASDVSYFKTNEFKNKTIDILCAWGGNLTTGLRKKSLDLCNSLKYKGYNIVTDNQKNYFDSISKSWIVIDAYGGGQCNARLWQICANYSLPCVQKWTIKYPNPFTHGENILEYENIDQLYDILKKYLTDKDSLKTMIINCFNHTKSYHTSQKRVEYIFDVIKK